MLRLKLLTAVGITVALAGCGTTSAKPAPTTTTTSSGTNSFFAHTADQAADTFTALNTNSYQVKPGGSMVRADGKSTLNMPFVGGMLGQGDQTRDGDYSIAIARVAQDTVRATLTLKSGATTRSVQALRGVVTGGTYYAVFVVKPAFHPSAVESITRTAASGKSVTAKR